MAFDFSGKCIVVAGGSRGIGRAIALGFAAAGAQVSICARGADALEATRADLARHGGQVHAASCDLASAAEVSAYGIGRAIALGFAAAGALVSICARGADALETTRADLARHGGQVHAASCNLASAAEVSAYVSAATAALGGIDVLVNNASGFGMGDDESAWDACLGVDVMAMVRASHAAEPALLARPGSSVVHIASISGYGPSTRAPAYAAAKAAMMSYTRSQAAMLARRGVRVNCIAPGSIEFPGGVWDQRKKAGEALYGRTLERIPFGRMGTPEEIAEVALFLASDHARWVTGQVIAVDGGQMLGV